MGKRIVRAISRPFIIIVMKIFGIKIYNKEKLPKKGPAILALNHRNYFDIFFIMSQYKGDEIIFVGRSTIKYNPLGLLLAWAYNVILVDRDGSDSKPLKQMIRVGKSDQILGIFPEGTRNGLHKGLFRSGATYVALRTKADIYPVGINGPLKSFSKGNYLKVGDKFNLSEMMKEGKTTKDRDEIERLNEIFKSKIFELIDDGFYDDIK